MNIFALQLFDDGGRKCTLYTVTKDGEEWSETEKFFRRFHQSEFKRPLQELAMLLQDTIGDRYGARDHYFRNENNAMALPPRGELALGDLTINYSDFPLRLHCLRISDKLLVLFNGGIKTSQKAQHGATSTAFREANAFARKIVQAMVEKQIGTSDDERYFMDHDGNIEMMIY